MFNIGLTGIAKISTTVFTPFSTDLPLNQFKWQIKLYHKDGGIKKTWWIGQQESPINKLNFEINKKLMGAGNITFSFLDFPIDGSDYLDIFYESSKIYRGKIESTIDPKGGAAKIIPYHNMYKNLLVDYNFINKTISEMLKEIIQDLQPYTGIAWNAALIDTGDTATYNKEYTSSKTPNKIFDDLIQELDDREWGVNNDNFFVVYQPEQTVTKNLFYTSSPAYTDVDVKKEWTKVEATRYFVYKKTGSGGDIEYVGIVGDGVSHGGAYPILNIESVLGEKREKKLIVSEVLDSDAEILDYAYSKLTAKAIVPEIIKVKNVDITKYIPEINQRLLIQDSIDNRILRTILNCDSISNDATTMNDTGSWSSVNTISVDQTVFVQNSKSLQVSLQNEGDYIYYDFGKTIYWNRPTKIGFMIRASRPFSDLLFSVSNEITGLWSIGNWSTGRWSGNETAESTELYYTNSQVYIPNTDIWFYREFPVTVNNFRYFGLKLNTALSESITINIDRVQMYLFHRETYESNVVKASFDITPQGSNVSMILNDYDIYANNDFFINDKRVRELEEALETV